MCFNKEHPGSITIVKFLRVGLFVIGEMLVSFLNIITNVCKPHQNRTPYFLSLESE